MLEEVESNAIKFKNKAYAEALADASRGVYANVQGSPIPMTMPDNAASSMLRPQPQAATSDSYIAEESCRAVGYTLVQQYVWLARLSSAIQFLQRIRCAANCPSRV